MTKFYDTVFAIMVVCFIGTVILSIIKLITLLAILLCTW